MDFLRSLVDAREGLVAAVREVLPGAAWQRCQAHFSYNVCKAAPKGVRAGLKGRAGREAQLPSAPEERLNREIERHACFVGVFPSKVSVIRLIGSALTEENECSSTQRNSYYG